MNSITAKFQPNPLRNTRDRIEDWLRKNEISIVVTTNVFETESQWVTRIERALSDIGRRMFIDLAPGGELTVTVEDYTAPQNQPRSELRDRIAHEINCVSAENGSDTPDFILAEYLTDCLDAFDKAVKRREKWYGRERECLPVGHPDAPQEATMPTFLK